MRQNKALNKVEVGKASRNPTSAKDTQSLNTTLRVSDMHAELWLLWVARLSDCNVRYENDSVIFEPIHQSQN